MNWINALAGFGVGLMVGITGVGGGSLMTPLLVWVFGIAPATAVGTDLWFAAITKLVGGAVHHTRGSVDREVLGRLLLGSLPASVLTLLWLHTAHVAQARHGLILNALGVVIVLTAVAMVFRKRVHALGQNVRNLAPFQFKRLQPPMTVLAGAILGFLVTLTSVGAGALGAVMLLYLYPFRMTPVRLVGTDIVHAIPLTIVAGSGHLLMGNVNLPLLGNLLIGSIPGIVLGSLLGHRIPEGMVRGAMALVLLAVGVKLIAG